MVMSFALFLGCTIPARLKAYETSSRAVLAELDVGVADIDQFNCCGYPVRNLSFRAFVLASARNLALAEKENLDIMTLCQCCYGSLKKADHILKRDEDLRDNINESLGTEGLKFRGSIEVRDLLSVLHDLTGPEAIRKRVVNPLGNLKVATHYGCHALRPADIVKLDDPDNPVVFDRLVEATGAVSVSWPARLECCGAPLLGVDDELSIHLAHKKLAAGKRAGAELLCVACPYCHLRFETVARDRDSKGHGDKRLQIVLYTQLLGLSYGMDPEVLGLTGPEIADIVKRS